MLLVPALNLNPKNSPARIRSYLKKAVADFQQRGLLDPGSGFESQNIIRLARPAPETGGRSWEQNS
jgi:hypothetical protein